VRAAVAGEETSGRFRNEPFCEGRWRYDRLHGGRKGCESAQIAFTKGGHGDGVRRLLASSPALTGATLPLMTASLAAPLIAGRYSEVGEEVGRAESFELYRNALHDVEVMTFDELFASAEGLITILEHGRASELLSIAAEVEASRGAR